MKLLRLFNHVPVIVTILLLLSFSFRSRHIDPNQLKTCIKQISDSSGFDTITIDVTKKMSIDDVLSMNMDAGRNFAFLQMKNGKKYVLVIPDYLRKYSDSVNVLSARYAKKPSGSNIDTVKVDGRSLTGIGIESDFPGGIRAWSQYMNHTLVYPDDAVANETQGKVVVKFVIGEDGKVCDITAESGPENLKKAAMKMIAKSPNWIPATLNGFAVKSYKMQPVNFRLENDGKPIDMQAQSLNNQSTDYTGLDTLSMDEMKKLTMADVDIMDVNQERTRAFVKLKNGKKYVVIISDDLRKSADSKYGSHLAQPHHYNRTDSLNADSTDYDKIFTKTEIESEYPGGIAAWYRYLVKNLVYPEDAVRKEIQGQVVVRFIVDTEGNVSNIEAVYGPIELRATCVALIKKSGKWTPAIQNGRKVKSYKSQPINFKLESH